MNIKKINDCFYLTKNRMKTRQINVFDKKQEKEKNKIMLKLTNQIEKMKKSFSKQEYEHYCDLYYVELINKNCDVDPPEHTQFATIN